MITPEIQEYIGQQREAGIPDAQIRQTLTVQGWQQADLDQAFGPSPIVNAMSAVAPVTASISSTKVITAVITTLVILGAGGYFMFSKRSAPQNSPATSQSKTATNSQQNSNSVAAQPFIVATAQQTADAAKLGMIAVPAGKFIIGVTSGEQSANVWPAQVVNIRSFYIDQTEVTNKAYSQFLVNHPDWQKGQVKYDKADGRYLSDLNNNAETGLLNLPVTWVSWFAAKAYCEANNKRLPTAAEWEKAARGTDGRRYPWGSKLDGSHANFCDTRCAMSYRDSRLDDGFTKLAPAGSFPQGVSPYGALDMSGNALEWVQDWEDRSGEYYKVLPTSDPTGPNSGRSRALKGGSWLYNENFYGIRPDLYFGFLPNTTNVDIGFRCAMDARIP